MQRQRSSFIFLVLIAFALLAAQTTLVQTYGFGQNKVRYKSFDWAVFRTDHFDVHYYAEMEQAARDAARMAERGYTYLSEVFDHQFSERIPLILYASLNDFMQTNVVDGIGHGTRGVTESLKGRVVLPITGSYREFNHVLVHELVHAFQFDLMLNPKNVAPDARGLNPPLWFVEGLAEYLAIEMDAITRMWVKDGLLHDNLLTVEQLNSTQDIRVYRLGESLWHFLGSNFDKKKVGQIFKSAVRVGDVNRALQLETGLDSQALTAAWHKHAREHLLPENSVLQKPAAVATKLTRQENFFHRLNVAPAISPDGRHIAYVTNKTFADDLFLLSERDDGTFNNKRLVKGSMSTDFENLRFFETGIAWSRDGKRLAFVSKSGKDDAIYVLEAQSGKQVQRLVFADLNGLLSPAFSPQGDVLVFSGIQGGVSDLFVVDLDSGERRRLTQDRFAALQPQWSPDGSQIAFISDRGPGTDEASLLFGSFELATLKLASGKVTLRTGLAGNVTSPQWSPDGREIAFVSDHLGIANIFKLDMGSGAIYPLTFFENGVAGITTLTPALSWSANGKWMAFSAFENGAWQIYRMPVPDAEPYQVHHNGATTFAAMQNGNGSAAVVLPRDSALAVDSLALPPLPEPNTIYERYELVDAGSIEARDYRSRFSFDGGVLGGTVGGFLGSTAGAALQFSDMLGNQSLLISAGLRLDVWNSDLSVAYINRTKRLNYGVEAFQFRSVFGAFATGNQLGYTRNTYRGANLFAQYPFSRFARVEAGVGATAVDREFVIDVFRGGNRDRFTQDLSGLWFGQAQAALVFDNTVYGYLGPMSGSRSRFAVQQAFNDFSFTTLSADYRAYKRIGSRSALAYRLVGAHSFGRDAQFFGAGGPYTYRGASSTALIGNNLLVQNLEYRFPLLPFLPANYDFLYAATFVDAAAAWGVDIPGISRRTFQPFSSDGGFRLQDLRAAFGFGARLNLGYFVLKYDLGFPTDLREVGKPVGQVSLGIDF